MPPWLTRGVRGIGLASLLSDFGHEIPTALLPSLLTSVLGAPAAAFGLIEGVAGAMSGVAKIAGGALADDPARHRSIAVGGYTLTAILSALIGVAGAVWQVAILRTGAWVARGVRGPARNALLADAVEPSQFGRAYGFEHSMDNAGAVGAPIIAILLVSLVGIQGAILLPVAYNVAATLASLPGGHLGDRFGMVRVLGFGFALFAAAYAAFRLAGPDPLVLGLAFVAAGVAIGAVETAEHAAVAGLASPDVRGSAFGLLAAIQSVGNLIASAVAGIVWTLVGPAAAFGLATLAMVAALAGPIAAHWRGGLDASAIPP
ncbi:MAG: MFS transporter [Candidatus Limnocylindrales bacterium]